ncbi:DUF6479 family protein [Streptomyces violascens]|uniref:DUF6479 family protein n=1 Tax=Streptomyces violascens TaxID=67381 RepID=UPI0036B3CE01
MTTFAHSQTLAAKSTSWLFTGVGIIVVAVLIGMFWFGSRRTARKRMPPQEHRPRKDSWQTPDATQASDTPDPDGHR